MCKKQLKDQSEKQKTPTWFFVLIAILLFFIFVPIIWIVIHKMGDVNLSPNLTVENWFSFTVTSIDVIITLFVGFQIFNIVEIRREIKDAEGKYEKIKNDTEQFKADFREFQSKLEKEIGAFKLEFLNKYNVTERELMKELNENTQKVDWYLKDLKKEHWDRLNDLNESIRKSKKTQEDIKKEMDDIKMKWTGILDVNNDFREALSTAFLFLETTDKRDDHRIFLLLTMIIIREDYSSHNKVLDMSLDRIISLLSKMTKTTKIKSVLQSNSKKMVNIKWDKENSDSDLIQQKIYKIISMINEIPDSPQQDGVQN